MAAQLVLLTPVDQILFIALMSRQLTLLSKRVFQLVMLTQMTA